MVGVNSAVLLLGGEGLTMALGRVGDGLFAVCHRPLRRKDRQVSRNRPGSLGLLHGSPPRLSIPLLGYHWLFVYSPGAFALPDPDHAGDLRRLRGEYFPGVCRYRPAED